MNSKPGTSPKYLYVLRKRSRVRDLHSAGSMDRDARRYKRIKGDKECTETSGFVDAER